MNLLNLALLFNSLVIIGFIFNQNESSKELIVIGNYSALGNLFENLTWASLTIHLGLLFIKAKTQN